MSQTKEAQRAELHKTIWRIANQLRGSVDGWDFKSYVLGILFYRFISENLTAYINAEELKAGQADFDYSKLRDEQAEFGRKETVAEKGFYILPSELFVNVRKRAARDENLNETLAGVFRDIEGSALGTDSEDDLKGLFEDLDVNSPKLGPTVAKRNERLVKLLDAIGDLDLGSEFTEHTIDAFGDAYEYLMTMYASSAGKSGGEFFTPQEVSELLARITVVGKSAVNKVYDPACGSGSLLLKFAKVLGKDNVRRGFFGQEVNLTTYNLARINMFLHDVNYEQFDIAHGDTLIDPAHWDDEPFEAIVSNPPYSINWAGDSNPLLITDPRYAPAGVLAPKSRADLAFTMHMLSWLAVNGTAAIVEFPGVLYRGGSEKKIRQYLVDNNFVDAVIQLPPDLFFGTTIATCILVLKKSKKDNAVLFIDASAEFVHVGNKNKMSPENQEKILDAFTAREDVDHFAKLVNCEDIKANGYNIAISSYVDVAKMREAIDVTALNAEIAGAVARQQELRQQINDIVTDLEGTSSSRIDDLIQQLCAEGVPLKALGDVGTIQRGRRFVKNDIVDSGTPCIHYGEIYTKYGISTSETFSFLNPDQASRLRSAQHGDVIIATAGETVEDIGKAVAWLGKEDVVIHDACYAFRSPLNPKYVAYFLQSDAFRDQARRLISSSKISSISIENLGKVRVPVPPLAVQDEIVRTLDLFQALEAELEAQLEAELKARRIQYQHYWGRLLAFTEYGHE